MLLGHMSRAILHRSQIIASRSHIIYCIIHKLFIDHRLIQFISHKPCLYKSNSIQNQHHNHQRTTPPQNPMQNYLKNHYKTTAKNHNLHLHNHHNHLTTEKHPLHITTTTTTTVNRTQTLIPAFLNDSIVSRISCCNLSSTDRRRVCVLERCHRRLNWGRDGE